MSKQSQPLRIENPELGSFGTVRTADSALLLVFKHIRISLSNGRKGFGAVVVPRVCAKWRSAKKSPSIRPGLATVHPLNHPPIPPHNLLPLNLQRRPKKPILDRKIFFKHDKLFNLLVACKPAEQSFDLFAD